MEELGTNSLQVCDRTRSKLRRAKAVADHFIEYPVRMTPEQCDRATVKPDQLLG